jgi:hypothetical protein
MSDFKIIGETDPKIPFIAQKLEVEEDQLKEFLPVFNEFYETVCFQHLAHLMRAMELFVRKKTNKPFFKIVWKKMPDDYKISLSTVNLAVGLKWDDKYGIVTPAKLSNNDDLRQLRVYVAHEMGHLFFSTINQDKEKRKDGKLHQDMANIFGVFAMLKRNEFYLEKAPDISHSSWKEVVDGFVPFVPKR